MIRPHAVVLVGTNVIIEAHRTGAWAALVGTYGVETVEDCVIETQTGYHRRTLEHLIDARDLRASLTAVHDVTGSEHAELAVRISDIALDRCEESLWAHSLGRVGTWLLSGPDRANLRVAVRLGLRERLVSLEELLEKAGHSPKGSLRPASTRKWMTRVVSLMVVAEFGGR